MTINRQQSDNQLVAFFQKCCNLIIMLLLRLLIYQYFSLHDQSAWKLRQWQSQCRYFLGHIPLRPPWNTRKYYRTLGYQPTALQKQTIPSGEPVPIWTVFQTCADRSREISDEKGTRGHHVLELEEVLQMDVLLWSEMGRSHRKSSV